MGTTIALVVAAVAVAAFIVLGGGSKGSTADGDAPSGPRTCVTFEVPQGPAGIEAEDIDAGDDLLRQLRAPLVDRGWRVGEQLAESWAAFVDVGADGQTFTLVAGTRGEGWLMTVSRSDRAALRPDSAIALRLLRDVDAALRSLDGVSNVAWHHASEWDRGVEDRGSASPIDAPSSDEPSDP